MLHMPPVTKNLWRSLPEFSDTSEYRETAAREFSALASEWSDDVSRRNFLKLMGASIALAGLSACTRKPVEKIVPYVKQPEELVPGQPLYFATSLSLNGYARGILVESHEGHPTKIEGNPDHPISSGASDLFMQAEILNLYDPDRSKTMMHDNEVATWDEFLGFIVQQRQRWLANSGSGLRLLTGHITSPTLLSQISEFLHQFPAAKWHVHEPLMSATPVPLYDLSKADVIVSLDADFLGPGPAQLKYARDFANRRRANADSTNFNRLYMAESTPSITGASADHRLIMSPSELRNLASTLISGSTSSKPIDAMLRDLRQRKDRSFVLVGYSLPDTVKQFARTWNQPLELAEPITSAAASLAGLVRDLEAKQVEALVILGANPAFDAPADFEFPLKFAVVPLRIRLGLYEDETSALCQWHIPETHPLETWSDARALDGTAGVIQPLIEPLYVGKSAHELLAALTENPSVSGYELVRAFWQKQHTGPDFEKFWKRCLHDGMIAEPATSSHPKLAAVGNDQVLPTDPNAHGLELLIRADPNIWDGRFSNNAWLQELPHPFTKLTWGNAALISPATAQRHGLQNEEVVELKYRGRSVKAPVWILPGQADDCVTVHLGYGRTRTGSVGNGVGFNAYALRTSDAPSGGPSLEIVKTGARHPLASTQQQQNMEGRELVRAGTLMQFQQSPQSIARGTEAVPARAESLYPPVEYKGHAWGMAINLGACIGCNVCTIACQAENNIPVVGREEVARGRAMHWIRVDNYFAGPPQNPRMHFQPVPCMHCENAPCELVCPVGATVHSSEGLNQMVYNRCIGTRYCSNNCPYKVRRFNFFEYDRNRFEEADILALLRNPDVSVRSRGVMEKCTYCIQRINRVRIESENHNRPIRDGEIVPACAQACPTRAITFGDINDPASRVAKLKSSPLNYGILAELNTRPRTSYLAKVSNPNPDLESA